MFYIVPLGNPGETYERTRHNVGWLTLDLALQAWNFPSLVTENKMSGRVTNGVLSGQPVTILYPDTFMNNSGAAVEKLVPKGEMAQLIVVHDDIDLPFGEIKVAKGRGAGGNNGVASIIQKTGSKDFVRVRIGIAPRSFWTGEMKRPKGGGPLERFVLKPFGKKEQSELPAVLETARNAVETVVSDGVEIAMNQYN